MPDELLKAVDRKAQAMDMTRSQYFRRLIRDDLEDAKKQKSKENKP